MFAAWINSDAPWMLFGSFVRALEVVVFIWVRWVHSNAPWRSSGLSEFIWTLPGDYSVHSVGSSVSFVFIGFIRVCPGGHLGASWVSGSFVFVGVIRARPWSH